MQINGLLKPPQIISLTSSKPGLESLKVGQELIAKTISFTANNSVTLQLNNILVKTNNLQIAPVPGQILELKVISTQPQLMFNVLRIIDNKPLEAGQKISATVVSSDLKSGITLQLNNNLVRANGNPAAHSPGQKLTLEVLQTTPQAVLRVLNTQAPTNMAAESLKTLLPKQTSSTPLLANMSFINNNSYLFTPILPRQLNNAIKELIKTFPSTDQVKNGEGLKQAISKSGLFLENNLQKQINGQKHILITQDVKANLLKLLNTIQQYTPLIKPENTDKPEQNIPLPVPSRSAPPLPGTPLQAQLKALPTLNSQVNTSVIFNELIEQITGTLARLQILQLTSQNTDEFSPSNYLFEIPLRNGNQTDVIHLRIEQENTKTDEEHQERWTASLAIDLENIGTVYANVTISQKQVWTKLWAEQEKTVALMNKHLKDLSDGFSQAGLEVGAINCLLGAPPPATSKYRTHYLVNTNA